MKLVVINASPIVGSSTELLLRAASEACIESHALHQTDISLESFRLNDLSMTASLIPCQSCGKSPTDEWCFYHDPLTEVLDAIGNADAVLIGSPIHFDAVSAQAKVLIDRCNCFRPADFADQNPNYRFLKRLPSKRPGGMILVGGPQAWFEGARRSLAGWFKWIEVENCGVVTYLSSDFNRVGTVVDQPEPLAEARALGVAIASTIGHRRIGPEATNYPAGE